MGPWPTAAPASCWGRSQWRGPHRGRSVLCTQPRVLTAVEISKEQAAASYNPGLELGEAIGYQTGSFNVRPAAGLIYTIGGSFWEFGGPDLDRAKLFVMIGTAEDHDSNPLKIHLSKFKRNGGTGGSCRAGLGVDNRLGEFK